jgi:hypothetical protein
MSVPTRLLLTMGPGLHAAAHGDLVVYDWNDQCVVDRHQHQLTAYEASHKGLAGACWHSGRLLVAAEAELLEIEVAPFRLVLTHTFPFLNDVHHIAADGEHIWICNSGLDCVEELDSRWRFVQTHDLIRPYGRRSAEVLRLMRYDVVKSLNRLTGRTEYYRHLGRRPPFRNLVKLLRPERFRGLREDLRNFDFRPHMLHPNHLLVVGGEVWVTLWQTGEIVSLRGKRVLASGLGNPHDGIPDGEEFFVTDCLNNRVVVHEFDPDGPSVGRKLREKVVTGDKLEGFLRGATVVEDRIYVGLTARRESPEFRTARVLCLDRSTLRPIATREIPTECGRSIFSVHDASEQYAGFESQAAARQGAAE